MSDFDIQHQVLRPKLIVCNGCTYRVLGDSALVDQVQDTDEHWDQQFSAVDFCEASNIMKDGEMYHLELKNIPTGLLAKILTEKLRKELEADSGVTIEIPPKGSKLSSKLVSPSEQGLAKAHDFIITLVESNRPKMTPNHFLSIPISTAEILQNYQDFAKKLQCDKEIKVNDHF
ncbi:hypothetical protein RF11_08855 [Thelohanellus kitauei]|uniref:Uncharacterized protein n=1 Tax=Thelohanellus kitauei TaxID=669202 RepID=A0A0C2MBN3_THEKT|nr:hypothetical protein RF11_08855 [Thelohanellus kitauei]